MLRHATAPAVPCPPTQEAAPTIAGASQTPQPANVFGWDDFEFSPLPRGQGLIRQDEIAEFLALLPQKRRWDELRQSLLDRLGRLMPVEPGALGAQLRIDQRQRLSWDLLAGSLELAAIERLRKELPCQVVRHLEIRRDGEPVDWIAGLR